MDESNIEVESAIKEVYEDFPNWSDRKEKVGDLVIYQESVETARRILNMFENERCVLLVAEPQEGKTSTAIKAIYEFIQKFTSEGRNWQVIWLCNISDNVLKIQTTSRIDKAGLYRSVQVLHHADIKKYIVNTNIQETFIIIDECHVAMGKNRPFHNFLKNFGIKYGYKKYYWNTPKGKNVYILNISATPFAHIIADRINDGTFAAIRLKQSENYCGIKNISKRMIQSEPIIDTDGDSVTHWFKERLEQFKEFCDKSGPGHLIIRSNKVGPFIIRDFIEKNYPDVNFLLFDDKKKNIPHIELELKNQPLKPTILCIRSSLRAGKTLPTTRHIRMWIEYSSSPNSDTIIQSAGRCCGYTTEDGHSKFEDTFPIFCDTKERELIIKFYEKYDQYIPKGNNNSSSHKNKKKNGEWVNVATLENIPEEYRSLGQTEVSGWATNFKANDDWLYSGHQRLAEDWIYGGTGDDARIIHWNLSDEDWFRRVNDCIKEGKASLEAAKTSQFYRKKCNQKHKNPNIGSWFYFKPSQIEREELVEVRNGPRIKKGTIFSGIDINNLPIVQQED